MTDQTAKELAVNVVRFPTRREPRTLKHQVIYCRQPFNVGRLLRTGALTLDYQPERVTPRKPVSL